MDQVLPEIFKFTYMDPLKQQISFEKFLTDKNNG